MTSKPYDAPLPPANAPAWFASAVSSVSQVLPSRNYRLVLPNLFWIFGCVENELLLTVSSRRFSRRTCLFADDGRTWGPPGTLHGGMQATLFEYIMRLVVGGNGQLSELRVDYKARVLSPGFYRVSGRISSSDFNGLKLSADLETQIDGSWTAQASATATRTLQTRPPPPLTSIPEAKPTLYLSADTFLDPHEKHYTLSKGGGFIWATCHQANVDPRFSINSTPIDLRGFMEFGAEATGEGGMSSGALVFSMMDHILGVYAAPFFAGLSNFTTTASMNLTIHYLPPVPCKLEWRAWLEKMEGRRIWVRGEVSENGRRVAGAEAVCVTLGGKM